MDTDMNEQSPEQLERWAAGIEKEIEMIKASIAPLEQRLEAARERLDLVQRLIRLTEGAKSMPGPAAELGKSSASGKATSLPIGRQGLEVHLEHILREAGKPMHISEIRQALIDNAIPLPGRGDEANIIVRLRRAPEQFTRTGRGMYALATLGLDAVPPARRRRRTRALKKA